MHALSLPLQLLIAGSLGGGWPKIGALVDVGAWDGMKYHT